MLLENSFDLGQVPSTVDRDTDITFKIIRNLKWLLKM